MSGATDERVIEMSKGKVTLLLVLGVMFAALCGWLWLLDDVEIRTLRPGSNPAWIHGIGAMGALLSVGCTAFVIRRLVDKRPGLVLNSDGMTDHSSYVAGGFIPWSDIAGFGMYQVKRTRVLTILLRDTEHYISRGGPIKRALNRANTRLVGSPLSISSSTLKIKFDDLRELLESYHRKYSRNA
jgi:hypothetical protein